MPVKSDITAFKQQITDRLDEFFGSTNKDTFLTYLSKRGGELSHWNKGQKWDNFLDLSEDTSNPDDDTEFKKRKDTVLKCLAGSFIEWKVDQGKKAKGNEASKQKEIKLLIKEIEDYQKDYTDPTEKGVYEDEDIKNLIKELKDLVKTNGGNGKPKTPFTKQTELKNLVAEVNKRTDLFTEPDKSGFISEINEVGRNNHYWGKNQKWENYLSESEIVKKAVVEKSNPNDEFARRNNNILYVLAKAYLGWYIYKAQNASSKNTKKEAIKKIDEYKGKYTETSEITAYNEKEVVEDIKAINEAINKKPTPKPSKPKEEEKLDFNVNIAMGKVKAWWEGVLDNYVKGEAARSNIIYLINKQGQDDKKFSKTEQWEDWFKTSKDAKELSDKWDWLEKEITKYLIDYWVSKGTAEYEREKKIEWWDKYIVKFYNKYNRDLARHYFNDATYNKKLVDFKTSFQTKPKDLNEAKKNAINELDDRMDELYTGASRPIMVSKINEMGTNDKSSDWGASWEECINKGTDENDIIERKAYILKYLTEYYIKDMLDRIDDQTDDGLAARFYDRLKDYKEKYGLEMGVYEAFEKTKTDYKAAEDRLKNIVAIGVPVDQVYTMIYARDYGRWAGKAARMETKRPRDDTGTQNYYKPSQEGNKEENK